jgi:hypothetical protein
MEFSKMKICSLLVLTFLFISCKKDYENDLDDVVGKWKLTGMYYSDSINQLKIVENKAIFLVFSNVSNSVDNWSRDKIGYQIIDTDTLNFSYQFDFSTLLFDISLKQTVLETMPISALGKIQVYQFQQLDMKKIEFFTENEYDYLHKQVLKNVWYQFTKE